MKKGQRPRRFLTTVCALIPLVVASCSATPEPPKAELEAAPQETPTGAQPPALPQGLGWEEECLWWGYGPEWAALAEVPETSTLDIRIDQENLNELFLNQSVWSDDPVRADYVLNGVPDVITPSEPSLRFRGNTSRVPPKRSLKIKINSVYEQPMLEDLNLNSMFIDPSFLRERLSFEMYRTLGLMAPETSYMSVFFNGEYEGLFLAVEDVDASFFKKYSAAPAELVTVRPRRSISRDFWQSAPDNPIPLGDEVMKTLTITGETDAKLTQELVQWLRVQHSSSVPAGTPTFNDMFDREYFLNFFAVASLIQDIDSMLDDFYLVRETSPGSKWRIAPWDKDLVMGAGWVPGVIENSSMEWDEGVLSGQASWVSVVLQDPSLKRDLESRILELGTQELGLQFYCSHLHSTSGVLGNSLELGTSDAAFRLYQQESFMDYRDGRLVIPLDLRHASLLDFAQLRLHYLETQINGSTQQRNKATHFVSEQDIGRSIFFTDSEGWTIGRLDVESVEKAGDVTLEIREAPEEILVDRTWKLETNGAVVRGKLNLYFRDKPGDSWYLLEGDDQQINEAQLGMRVILLKNDSEVTLERVLNPLSNRVMFDLPQETSFILALRPPSD